MNALPDWGAHPLAGPLLRSLHTARDAVLQAPPGAGKSTIVPLALLASLTPPGQRILMLEPRRLAARAVASRLAHNLGEAVGATVGYRMRLDTRVSRATRIEVITEGVLTRLLQSDPALEGVAWLVFDEYHERSLQADLGLALALDARDQLEAQFRVLVMSATLDGARVASLLGAAPLVEVPGRSHSVEVHYLGRGLPPLPGPRESPESSMAQAIRRALDECPGDILAFLPGGGEIRRVQRRVEELALPGVVLLPLYGELGYEAQDLALHPDATGRRRVILATNIAETSLTIAGVSVVVDSGLVRRPRFDPATGMSRLDLARVSRASAEQRAGRAGRTAPGHCYRLWSQGAQEMLAAHAPPEIAEADLAPLALELANWGCTDPLALRWLDPPSAAPLAQARELLQQLGALGADGRISAHGRHMAALPVHPRLAHMLLAAPDWGLLAPAAELAALLGERDLLRQPGQRDPDIRSRLAVLRGEQRGPGNAPAWQRLRRQSELLASRVAGLRERAPASDANAIGASSAAGHAGAAPLADELALLALAFPDRVGQRRPGSEPRYLLANGRGAAFRGAHSLARSPCIVALELDDREREARIDLAAPLAAADLERLHASTIARHESVAWDAREQAVVARVQRRFGALVLEDRPLAQVPEDAALAALLAGIRALGLDALPWTDGLRQLQARMEFVRRGTQADLAGWPASDDAALLATLEQWLAPWLAGVTRRSHLQALPLADALRARLDRAQLRLLEERAPRSFRAPTGSEIAIDYLDDNAPCVAVRLQEVFGLAASPRLGDLPLTFKLLSPARRPVQITRDLAGFWRGSYAEVRKQLRGRYPKHYWPEDPLRAEPRRGTRPLRA